MSDLKLDDAKEILNQILAEVESADTEMFKPNGPFNPKNETVIGECDDPLIRKIWSISQFYRREAEHAKVDAKINGTDIRYDGHFNKHDDISDLLHILFWVLLRSRHQLWAKGGIGIRSEWRIVKLKDDDEYNCDGGHPKSRSGVIAIEGRDLPRSIRKLIEDLGS
jgi:hypothetical protein